MIVDERKQAALQTENELLHRRIADLEHELAMLWYERDRANTAEQALLECEAHYRMLGEAAPSATLLIDLDGVIRFCNQQAAHLFGYTTADALYASNIVDLIVCDQRDSLPFIHAQPDTVGYFHHAEYTLRRSDNSRFPAEMSCAAVPNRQGDLTAVALTIQDTSERKRAEFALTDAYQHLEELSEHLLHSRNLLQVVFDGLEEGLVLLDEAGQVQIINRTLAALLGSAPQQLMGQNWATLYPRIAPDFPDHLTLIPEHGHSRYRHTRYLNLDGATRIFEVQTIPLNGASSAAAQFIIHVIDVTDTVQLQARILENERFIASGRLAASVAHEMNTPLQSLQTALGLARKIDDAAERDMFLTHAQEETQRVARIVRQLLDLYRPGANTSGPVAINTLIERVLLLIGKHLRDQRITVECALADSLPPIEGRDGELMQVCLNLVINAIDAMPDGGVLQIQTSTTTGTIKQMVHRSNQFTGERNLPRGTDAVCITITDSGQGINPTLCKQIFEPFVTTKAGGTGLGLSICSQIVAQHGGEIRVDSQIGIGSTFTVMLPISVEHEDEAPYSAC